MPFEWSFWTSGTSLTARLACWPIEPGSLVITTTDGIITNVIIDNGDGTLGGDGVGTVDYDYGFVGVDFSPPIPASGSEVKADYDPVEGGCADDCGKCATHYIRLDIVPTTISGSEQFTITDAWRRLFEKIRRDILPIHVEILNLVLSEYFLVSVGYRFDIIPADEEPLDGVGLRALWDDTSW